MFRKPKIAIILCIILLLCIGGCIGLTTLFHKKPQKPLPKPSPKIEDGTVRAEKGNGQSDVPLRVGCGSFQKKFNPFLAVTDADRTVVKLTQLMLFDTDRSGQVVTQGINGEQREYNSKNDTYFGPADLKAVYIEDMDITELHIEIRDDLTFSDGEPITIDDVIFSMYVFCDPSYEGVETINSLDIVGLEKYIKSKKKDSIDGIIREDDYSLCVKVNGKPGRKVLSAFCFPICPLHYYGDQTKYQYDLHRFGFVKGDLSSVRANQTSPMGAGAYRFIKHDAGITYFMANDLYFMGCPKTVYLYLQDMTKVAKTQEISGGALAEEISGNTVDFILSAMGISDYEVVKASNPNQKLSGKTIRLEEIRSSQYYYLRMNSRTMLVGTDGAGDESKNLRKAFATIFSACREIRFEGDDSTYELINDPISMDSWMSPKQYDEEEIAYAKDLSGEAIYREKDDVQTRREKAKEAALNYLEAAGFVVDNHQVTVAPDGAKLQYSIWVQGGESNPMYKMLEAAVQDFADLGFTIDLITVTDRNTMQEQLATGKQEIWCGMEYLQANPNLAMRIDGQGNAQNSLRKETGIHDTELTTVLRMAGQILDPEKEREYSQQALDTVWDWAVEVPVYQSKVSIMTSAQRIEEKSLPQRLTMYYTWIREVHQIVTKVSG